MVTIIRTPQPSWMDNPERLARFRIGRLGPHGACHPFNDNTAINVGKYIDTDLNGLPEVTYFVRVNNFVHSECRNVETAVKRCLELRERGVTLYVPRLAFPLEAKTS